MFLNECPSPSETSGSFPVPGGYSSGHFGTTVPPGAGKLRIGLLNAYQTEYVFVLQVVVSIQEHFQSSKHLDNVKGGVGAQDPQLQGHTCTCSFVTGCFIGTP